MRTGEGLHRFVDPVDGSVYLLQPVRDGRRAPDVRLLRPARPEGDVRVDRDRPRGLGGRVQHRTRVGARAGARRHGGALALPADPADLHLHHRAGRRAVPRGAGRRTTVIPLGVYCRASLAEYLDADAIFEVTKQGFDFFHQVFGRPYPFGKYDQLFVPEFNAGRDGERRGGHLPGGLRLPLPGHRRARTSAAPRRSCTRWRTCGSATSSPCAGGTTCG